jgi:hypothetical protein
LGHGSSIPPPLSHTRCVTSFGTPAGSRPAQLGAHCCNQQQQQRADRGQVGHRGARAIVQSAGGAAGYCRIRGMAGMDAGGSLHRTSWGAAHRAGHPRQVRGARCELHKSRETGLANTAGRAAACDLHICSACAASAFLLLLTTCKWYPVPCNELSQPVGSHLSASKQAAMLLFLLKLAQ